MLTRLRVSGFKNLVDVDIRFGPFTCIAGGNGVGKSNLFDAIHFLSMLADKPFVEAAFSIRNPGGMSGDIRSLFHHIGDDYAPEMSFVVEMIVPREGEDDLGQATHATTTFLRYTLRLAYQNDFGQGVYGKFQLLEERLENINQTDAPKNLLFHHHASKWRASVMGGKRVVPFISTATQDGTIIQRHQDGGSSGKPYPIRASTLPRTVLSVSNGVESPTAMMARIEMRSWKVLQLEPSALREPDSFTSPSRLGVDGAHLPATMLRLSRMNIVGDAFTRISNRLSELVDDVGSVEVEQDDRREILTLIVRDRDDTSHPGRALSDGTLRFMVLGTIEIDPEEKGVICLEEPENGMHPERISSMIRLLEDIAVDVSRPVGDDNPLRQVIINTHSPSVVAQIKDDNLLVAELQEKTVRGRRCKCVVYSPLPDTWRMDESSHVESVSRSKLLAYLDPFGQVHGQFERSDSDYDAGGNSKGANKGDVRRRVIDRPDLRGMIPLFPEHGV